MISNISRSRPVPRVSSSLRSRSSLYSLALPRRSTADRQRKLEQAEQTAQETFERRKSEEEKKFLAEQKETEGDDVAKLQALTQQTEKDKQSTNAMFEKGKADVIQLLLHFATTCQVSLSENQRQAFLAMQRKEQEKAGGGGDD